MTSWGRLTKRGKSYAKGRVLFVVTRERLGRNVPIWQEWPAVVSGTERPLDERPFSGQWHSWLDGLLSPAIPRFGQLSTPYRDLSERSSCEAEVSKLAFVAGVF